MWNNAVPSTVTYLSTSRPFFFFKEKMSLLKSEWCTINEICVATGGGLDCLAKNVTEVEKGGTGGRESHSFLGEGVGAVFYAEVQPQKTAVWYGLFFLLVDAYFLGLQKTVLTKNDSIDDSKPKTLHCSQWSMLHVQTLWQVIFTWLSPTLTLTVGSGTYLVISSGSCSMDSGLGLVSCALMWLGSSTPLLLLANDSTSFSLRSYTHRKGNNYILVLHKGYRIRSLACGTG